MEKRAFRLFGLVGLALGLAVRSSAGEARGCEVDPGASTVKVHVGKAGLLKFAGHEHDVVAPVLRGRVVANPEDISRSSVDLAFSSEAIKVVSSDGPASDIPKVQATMTGPRVLDVARFAVVEFRSAKVEGRPISPGSYEVSVTGELSLHGVSKPLRLAARVELSADTIVASGRTALRQTDFGMEPVSVGGVVKVRNELAVEFRVLARCLP